jgi:uncharacterized protein YprB with RNaseH-like and TPR domain
MIEKTFCHIKGITTTFEKLLWNNAIRDWNDFFEKYDTLTMLPKGKLEKIKNELPASKEALAQKNLGFFKNTLASNEHWRLSSLGKIAFVDIETTGISRTSDEITVIGIYDGVTPHLYVNGQNLEKAHSKLKEFDIVVTFNGKQFDIPFIETHFSCSYDFIHLDLRYMFKELGFQGGLKNIERQLGITRACDIQGIDGFEAVNLWYRYKRGNLEALQTLLKYNREDIVNLEPMLNYYLKKKIDNWKAEQTQTVLVY